MALIQASQPDALVEAKRAFYRQPDIAEHYNLRRFGGAGGSYVHQREAAIVARLLPAMAPIIADVGTGTGRLLPLLGMRGRTVIGIDASLPMLHIAARTSQAGLAQGDAFSLPFGDGAVDAAVSLRVLFHFQDVLPLLRELRRITRVGGTVVCDTSSWSPRSLIPLDRRHWGERVMPISSRRFARLAESAGLRVANRVPGFLISPYVYRLLPVSAAHSLERLEALLPQTLLCRDFWQLEAVSLKS